MQSTKKIPGAQSSFGSRVLWLRSELGLPVQKFAAFLGCDRSYIYKLESGDADNPSLDFIVKIVLNFKVSRLWLESGVGLPFDAQETNRTEPVSPAFSNDEATQLAVKHSAGLSSLRRLSDEQLNLAAHFFMFGEGERPVYIDEIFTELTVLIAWELRRRGKLPSELFGSSDKLAKKK